MTAPVKIVGFVAALALVFTLGLGLGRAVGPLDIGTSDQHTADTTTHP